MTAPYPPTPITLPSIDQGLEDVSHRAILIPVRRHQYGSGAPVTGDAEIDFRVEEEAWRVNPTFHPKTKTLRVRIVYEDELEVDIFRVHDAIDAAYELFVKNFISEANDNDRVFITFRNPTENREVYISFYVKNFDRKISCSCIQISSISGKLP